MWLDSSMNTRTFNIGGVKVEILDKVINKFRVLRMAMDNWSKMNYKLSNTHPDAIQYMEDCDNYNYYLKLHQTAHKRLNTKHKKKMNRMFWRYNEQSTN